MENYTATILIVDDEQINRHLFQIQLRGDGYRTRLAASGGEALALIAEEKPDLVLLDVMMPGMSGFEVVARLKAAAATRNIPVIMVTALDDAQSRLAALGSGAEEFLTKPVNRAELLARVRNLLKLKLFQDDLEASRHALAGEVAERTQALVDANLQLSEAQAQLVQSEKLASLGLLAAGVAHEINNPIGYVSANLGSLEKYVQRLLRVLQACKRVDAEGQSPALTELQALKQEIDFDFVMEDMPILITESLEGIARVRKIVQDLKNFSRVDNQADWQLADLHKCLESTLNVACNEIKYKADLAREFGELPEVECKPSQLNQVFLNILLNAAHAIDGDARGRIAVRTGRTGDEVWVEVADSGCGIAPEVLPHIFDPFFTTKPVGVGTGLGLSISYGIVRDHGGRIEVDSTPGIGSCFRIVLPIRRARTDKV